MRKLLYSLLFVVAAAFTACDDYIDLTPKGAVTVDSAYTYYELVLMPNRTYWPTCFALLTDEASVVKAAAAYFPWAVAVPLAGVAAFVWDGVFIGVTATRGMLLSSLVATLVFFVVYVVFRVSLGNHALWMAFVVYLAVRGVVQTALWKRVKKARGVQ